MITSSWVELRNPAYERIFRRDGLLVHPKWYCETQQSTSVLGLDSGLFVGRNEIALGPLPQIFFAGSLRHNILFSNCRSGELNPIIPN